MFFMTEDPRGKYMELNFIKFSLEEGVVQSYRFVTRREHRDVMQFIEEMKSSKERWMKLVSSLSKDDFQSE